MTAHVALTTYALHDTIELLGESALCTMLNLSVVDKTIQGAAVDETSIWLIGVVALVVGVLAGYLLGRGRSDGKQKELSDELAQTHDELERYREQVTAHFAETANLVNGLTEQYRKVHEHLSSGAQTLCTDNELHQLLEKTATPVTERIGFDLEPEPPVEEPIVPPEEEEIQPPRDYAPKSDKEAGMLSEEYTANYDRPAPVEPEAAPVDPATPAVDEDEKEKPR